MSNKINYNLQINNHKKKEFADALHYSLDCLKSNNYYDTDQYLDSETISWRAFTYGKKIYDFLIKIMEKMSDDNDNDWLLDNQEINQNCNVESMMENLFTTGEFSTIKATNNQDQNIDTNNNNTFVSFYNNNENNDTLDCSNSSYDEERALEYLNTKKNESEVDVNNNYSDLENFDNIQYNKDCSNSSYDEERALEYLNTKKNESEVDVNNNYSDLENFNNIQYNKDNKLPDNFFTKLTRDAENIIVHHNSRSFNAKYDVEEFSPKHCSTKTENYEDPWAKLNSNCFVKIESDDEERALQWIQENEIDTVEDDYQQRSGTSLTITSDESMKLQVDQNDKDPWMGSKKHCSVQLEPDNIDPLEWTDETELAENVYQQEENQSFEIKSDHLINPKVDDENNEDPWIKLRSRCSVHLNSDDVEKALEWIEENKNDIVEDVWQQSDTFRINSDGLMKLKVDQNDDGVAWVSSKRHCSIQLKPVNVDPPKLSKETETIENNYQQGSSTLFKIKSEGLKNSKVNKVNEDPWNKLRARCFVQIRPDDIQEAHKWIEKKEKMNQDYEEKSGKINSNDLIIGDLVYVKCLEHKFKDKKLGDELIRRWAREIKQKMKNNNKPFNPNFVWTSKFKKYYNITGDNSDLKVNYNLQAQKNNSESSYNSNETYSNKSGYSSCSINKKDDDDDDYDDYYVQNNRYNKKIKTEKKDNFYRSIKREDSKKIPRVHGYNLRNIKKEKIIKD